MYVKMYMLHEYDDAFVESVINELQAMSAEERQAFVERVGSIEWQLMSGERRQADVDSDEALADAFDVFGLGDPDVDIAEDHDFFHVNVEGYHRSIFLNTASVEWNSSTQKRSTVRSQRSRR
jgi:hypothetical protein